MKNARTTESAAAAQESGAGRKVFSPSELNREVKNFLESGFARILLEGEISNLSLPSSGHMYFSLKDDKAQVRCALFRSARARVAVPPENGMKVLVSARITLYEARGDYQLIVESLEHAGAGLLQQKFEQLKAKLQAEGLFDPVLKKPLPPYPLRIALVTSPSGAAVRDMIHVLGRRWPVASVRIYGVPVQGAEAPPAMVRALAAVERHGWAQVVLMGRGGGSLEDLWAFNEEVVARAVAASGVPVISAVGHETDFTISDFVADVRAPTPSAAAELCVPDARVLRDSFVALERRMSLRIADRCHNLAQKFDHAVHRLQQAHPRRRLEDQARRLRDSAIASRKAVLWEIERVHARFTQARRQLLHLHPSSALESTRNDLKGLASSLNEVIRRIARDRANQLAGLAQTLDALSPLKTVGRGYALITASESRALVSSVLDVPVDRKVTAQLRDGRLDCLVEKIDEAAPDAPLHSSE